MRGPTTARLGNFVYRGLDHVSAMEASAIHVCQAMFGAAWVEFRCLSGIHAMQTTVATLTKPGDTVMRIATKDGGHFLTETICRLFGRRSCTFVFDRRTRRLDIEATARVIRDKRPALLYLDLMNYLFPFPVKELREIADGVPIVYDASHTLGLIAGGQFQSPLREGADILQGNTHKTLFGPQKGLILGNDESLMDQVIYGLSTGLVSSQHTAETMALFVALHETYYYGREYAIRTVANAQFLARALYEGGLSVLEPERGFTANHQLFVDLRPIGSGPSVLDRLIRANISANRTIAFEHLDALRIGVQEVTRYGFDENDLRKVSRLLIRVVLENERPDAVRQDVVRLVRSRRAIHYAAESPERATVEGTEQLRTRMSVTSGPHDEPYGQATAQISTEVRDGVRSGDIGLQRAAANRWFDLELSRISVAGEISRPLFGLIRKLGESMGPVEGQFDSAGNISFVESEHVFVTASGAFIGALTLDDFVKVVGQHGNKLMCEGIGPPSTEVLLHMGAYSVTEARVVAHFHHVVDPRTLPDAVSVTGPHEYGSRALADGVARGLSGGRVVYIRAHGFVLAAADVPSCQLQLIGLLEHLGLTGLTA